MIKVTVGNTTNRKDVIVDETASIKEIFTENGFTRLNGVVHLNGTALRNSDLNKTIGSFGVGEACSLISVIKLDNA